MDQQPIRHTRFVPIAYNSPDGCKVSSIRAKLGQSSGAPLVVFFTHQKLEFPQNKEMPIVPKVIKLHPKRIPEGPEFAEFKRTIFEFRSESDNNSNIGVASSKGDDVCLYIILRWIIEEKGQDPLAALAELACQVPPGIIKPKYLLSLEELYGCKLVSDKFNQSQPGNKYGTPQMAFQSPLTPNLLLQQQPGMTSPIYQQNKVATPVLTSYNEHPQYNYKSVSPAVPDFSDHEDFVLSPAKDDNLLAVEADDSRILPIKISEDCDPILLAVGTSVGTQENIRIRDEIKDFFGLFSEDPPLQLISQFNRSTISSIKEDQELYCFMKQPKGIRCILFARGKFVYIIGENGFTRCVKCFIPETQTPDQTLVYSIFEGILCRLPNSNHPIFIISDCLMYESTNMRFFPFFMRFQHADKTVHDRESQISKGINKEKYIDNDIKLELRMYYRLKYLDYMNEHPDPLTYGYVFARKKGIHEKMDPMFLYKENDMPFISVKIEAQKEKCYGTIGTDSTRVVEFSNLTKGLMENNGNIIDIEYDFSSMQWQIKSLSSQSAPNDLSGYLNATKTVQLGPLSIKELIFEMDEIRKLPQYVAEDNARKMRKG